MLHNDIEKVLIDEETLHKKVQELAEQISKDYKDTVPFAITVLKGGVFFATDILRRLSIPAQMDFMVLSSYGDSTESSGKVKIVTDLSKNIEGRDVLILEDIVDSGISLNFLKDLLLQRKPKSVKICTILNKPARRKTEVDLDYCGFEVPDEFLVGYGLDYAEKYRNLPYVGVLKREIYEK